MLGSVRDSGFGHPMKQPDEVGTAETQNTYIIVEDADTHYARAKATGAEIVIDIKDQDYTCRDPEGHIWNLGSYDPWRER